MKLSSAFSNPKIIAALAALLLLLVLIGWVAGFFASRIDPTLLTTSKELTPDTQLYTVADSNVVVTETIPATIAARDDTIISSRILARINEVKVRAGDTVTRNQILIELEQASLKSRVNQASDQINAISAQLEEARLRLTRVRELLDRGLAARADLDSANASYDNLAAQLSNSKEMLAEAEIVLGYSTIRAPINGRVVERLAEPGDTVSPGTQLLSLYDPVSIRAEAPVREALALQLSIGQEITVELGALNISVPGTIEEIVPAADPTSRSFLVKVAIGLNPELMPGMFARFIVPVEEVTMTRIPERLVTGFGELSIVHVASDGFIERRIVRLGKRYPDGLIAVRSGLSVGETLVVPDEE